jgi:ubiquinone/menaquinone biosynthesis C-methylase UbiE
MPVVMDWDAAYRNEIFAGPPPWNIGDPQPEIVALIENGNFRGPVLDVGCGVGDASLELAARGYEVVGIDLSQTAIAAATKAAEERGLNLATFIQGDVTKLDYDATFNSVLDCTLFHSLPLEARDDYLGAVHRAAAPGASLHMLVFTTDALPADSPFPVPNLVTKDELRQAVSKHWAVDAIDPAHVYVQLPDVPNLPAHSFEVDDHGRVKLPAFLLSARKTD